MVEIYDDHEQSERVRDWMKENGAAIVMGIVLAIGGLYGWKNWQISEQESQGQVATEFQNLALALDDERFDKAYAHFETIRSEYSKSAYLTMAQLMIAQARLQQGQAGLAETIYRDILDTKSKSDEFIRYIAAERLARLLIHKGDLSAAEVILNKYDNSEAFASRFAEVRGDLLIAKGDTEGAQAAYQKALDSMEAGTGDRRMLELKRDNPIAIVAATEES